MEALTACAFAALLYCGLSAKKRPTARIDGLEVLKKEGGKSGKWGRLVEDANRSRLANAATNVVRHATCCVVPGSFNERLLR